MPGRNQAPQYTYTLSAHPYIKPTALQSPAQKAPSPCGGGLGWGSSAYLAAQLPTALPLSPAQRGRDGEGVTKTRAATAFTRPLLACLLLAGAACYPAQAQDATAGLYICPAPGGMNNIVSKPTGDNCRPYQKGALGGNNPAPAAAPAPQPVAQPTPLPVTTPKPAKNETAKGGYTWDEDDTPAKPTAKNNEPTKAPEAPANNLLFPPAANYNSDPRGSGDYYRDLGIRPGKPGSAAAATPATRPSSKPKPHRRATASHLAAKAAKPPLRRCLHQTAANRWSASPLATAKTSHKTSTNALTTTAPPTSSPPTNASTTATAPSSPAPTAAPNKNSANRQPKTKAWKHLPPPAYKKTPIRRPTAAPAYNAPAQAASPSTAKPANSTAPPAPSTTPPAPAAAKRASATSKPTSPRTTSTT